MARPDCDLPTAIENIDIGGPTMVRSAAKNHRDVAIVVDAGDYPRIVEELQANGGTLRATRFDLAVKAFEHTARYDGAIANYLGRLDGCGGQSAFPRTLSLEVHTAQEMRHGAKPHHNRAV